MRRRRVRLETKGSTVEVGDVVTVRVIEVNQQPSLFGGSSTVCLAEVIGYKRRRREEEDDSGSRKSDG